MAKLITPEQRRKLVYWYLEKWVDYGMLRKLGKLTYETTGKAADFGDVGPLIYQLDMLASRLETVYVSPGVFKLAPLSHFKTAE